MKSTAKQALLCWANERACLHVGALCACDNFDNCQGPSAPMLQKLLWPFHTEGTVVLAPVAIAAMYLLLRMPRVGAAVQRNRTSIVRGLGVCGIGAAAFFLIADIATIPLQHPFQDDESSVLSVAAAWVHHQPMYPPTTAAVDYGVLYGPATFLLFTPPMFLHAEKLMWFQAWVALGLVCMLLLALLALRRVSRPNVALLAFGYYVVTIGLKAANQWSNKGDPWILFFLALGFWAALRLRERRADLVVAACGAVLIDLKINLLLLALLPFLLIASPEHRRLTRRLPAIVVMCLGALAFFLLPGISLSGYREELALAARHGLSTGLFRINLMYLVRVFLLPFLASLWMLLGRNGQGWADYLRRRGMYLLLLGGACVVAAVTGAKNGAGAWHLVPLALPFAVLLAELWHEVPPFAGGDAALRLAPAVWIFGALAVHGVERTADAIRTRHVNDISLLREYDTAAVRQDMLQIETEHPYETLQVGVSDGPEYSLAQQRYFYILRGQPLFADPNARAERDAAHVPFSPAVLRALADCRISLWLIPSGAPPFAMGGGYASPTSGTAGLLADPYLYPQPWPSVFAHHYHRIGSSRYFDLWLCNQQHRRS